MALAFAGPLATLLVTGAIRAGGRCWRWQRRGAPRPPCEGGLGPARNRQRHQKQVVLGLRARVGVHPATIEAITWWAEPCVCHPMPPTPRLSPAASRWQREGQLTKAVGHNFCS
eukprot:6072955-Lingulodinium_polyedra.AAC.1